MATTERLHEINAFPEFRTAQGIDDVKKYVDGIHDKTVHDPVIPQTLNARQRHRWIEKFSRDFVVQDDMLFYRPRNRKTGKSRMFLEIVPPELRQDRLQKLYGNAEGLSVGINAFYYQVCSHFLNIPREICEAFLKRQTIYQVTRDYIKKPTHPILASSPNERWEVDNVYMFKYGLNDSKKLSITEHNNHHEPNAEYEKPLRVSRHSTRNLNSYIAFMTCIDIFSNKVWIEPLLNIDSENTARALKRICERAHTFPKIVQTDGGAEFRDKFDKFIDDHNETHPVNKVKHYFATPHDPQSNSKCERMNRTVRKKIREIIVRTGELEWVQYIPELEESINSNRITGTHHTPNQLWRPGWFGDLNGSYTISKPTDESTKQEIVRYHQVNLYDRVTKHIENNGDQFQVDDLVRVANEEYHTPFRARVKNEFGKKYSAIVWSPELYRVVKVNPQKTVPWALRKLNQRSYDIGQIYYTLRTYPGNEVCKKTYARSQLQKAGTVTDPPVDVPYDIVKKEAYLNRFE